MKKSIYLLHGFIFAAGSAVIIYVTNRSSIVNIPPSDILFPAILSVVIFLLLVLGGYLLTRKLEDAGLIASFLILGFLYLWQVFLLILISTVLSLLSIKIIYKKFGYIYTHLVLVIISVTFVGYYLFQFYNLVADVPGVDYQQTIQPIQNIPTSISSLTNPPDIYYIILDSYGRADMLKSVYGFDNSSFMNGLEQRGFFVASRSQANYPKTVLSRHRL